MNYFRTKDLNVKEIATFSLISFAMLKCLSIKLFQCIILSIQCITAST